LSNTSTSKINPVAAYTERIRYESSTTYISCFTLRLLENCQLFIHQASYFSILFLSLLALFLNLTVFHIRKKISLVFQNVFNFPRVRSRAIWTPYRVCSDPSKLHPSHFEPSDHDLRHSGHQSSWHHCPSLRLVLHSNSPYICSNGTFLQQSYKKHRASAYQTPTPVPTSS
jgi:hypothetical protein